MLDQLIDINIAIERQIVLNRVLATTEVMEYLICV